MTVRKAGAGAGAALALLLLAGAAQAMPGEMPWDHAGGPGRPDCTACHFDAGAIPQSPALSLEGLPERAVSGAEYKLAVRLRTDELQAAGFLMRAEIHTAEGKSAAPGRFTAAEGRTEAGDGAIRSTVAGAQATAPGLAEWRFSWRAPEGVSGTVTMYIAAVAANDDLSPLGDGVHLLRAAATLGNGGG